MYCSHCDLDVVRRNGLCQACSVYERREGVLPPKRVLAKRTRLRERRRQEQAAFLVQLGPELTRELARLYAEDRRRQVVA